VSDEAARIVAFIDRELVKERELVDRMVSPEGRLACAASIGTLEMMRAYIAGGA
jgi:hypothetical protein